MNLLQIGTSTYSYWHFKEERVPIEYVMEQAAALGLDGVEILHVQMESEDNVYLQRLKRTAFVNGLDIYCLSIHQGFVSPDAEIRKKNIAHTRQCIETAYKLGAPAIRLNSGRWGTLKSFDELMANRGVEPALPGYTEDDAFGWVIDSIEQCLPKAEECGVILALENHWGLTYSPEGVNRIVESVNSDWLKVTMDCGNFLSDIYESLQKIAPHTVLVHAKTYLGGGEWYTLEIDYSKVAEILSAVNFKGYVSIEFEGKEDPLTGMPKSIEMIRDSWVRGRKG
ncbi:sugar phosphate isomerase/epimerase [Candidatus Poribacteria bacterium]|nr:sugar phosphate isomerase/epimerase [Candidatus Poribacteria bacterium]